MGAAVLWTESSWFCNRLETQGRMMTVKQTAMLVQHLGPLELLLLLLLLGCRGLDLELQACVVGWQLMFSASCCPRSDCHPLYFFSGLENGLQVLTHCGRCTVLQE